MVLWLLWHLTPSVFWVIHMECLKMSNSDAGRYIVTYKLLLQVSIQLPKLNQKHCRSCGFPCPFGAPIPWAHPCVVAGAGRECSPVWAALPRPGTASPCWWTAVPVGTGTPQPRPTAVVAASIPPHSYGEHPWNPADFTGALGDEPQQIPAESLRTSITYSLLLD